MLRFEWDSVKARTNLQKHSVSFEDAMHAIGLAGGVAVLLVVHTVREEGEAETIRLISARQATRKERNRYEQSCTQELS